MDRNLSNGQIRGIIRENDKVAPPLPMSNRLINDINNSFFDMINTNANNNNNNNTTSTNINTTKPYFASESSPFTAIEDIPSATNDEVLHRLDWYVNNLGSKITINNKEYTTLKVIGQGGFATVFSVIDTQSPNRNTYALKFMEFTLNKSDQNNEDKVLRAAEEEVEILKVLQGVPRMIQMITYQKIRRCSIEGFCQFSILFELADSNLRDYIKHNAEIRNKEESMHFLKKQITKVIYPKQKNDYNIAFLGYLASNVLLLKSLFWSMLKAVHTLHQLNIIHADIKPENMLIYKGDIVLSDFGLSRKINTIVVFKNPSQRIKAYASQESPGWTFLYKAPEVDKRVILDNEIIITPALDVWSLGRCLFEFVYGQEFLIYFPTEKMNEFFSKDWKTQNNDFNDLLRSMLRFNFKERITLKEAIIHPFFTRNNQDLVLLN